MIFIKEALKKIKTVMMQFQNNKKILVVIAILFFSIALYFADYTFSDINFQSILNLFILGFILLITIMWLINDTDFKKGNLLIFILLGLALKIISAYAFYVIAFKLNVHITDDALTYDNVAWSFAQNFRDFNFSVKMPSLILSRGLHYPGYYIFVSFIYTLFGHNYLAVFISQGFLSFASSLFCFKISKQIFDENVAKYALIFTMFYAEFIVGTNAVLKDSLVSFLVISCIWSFFEYRRTHVKSYLALYSFFILLLGITRLPFSLLVIVVLFVYTLINLGREKKTFLISFASINITMGILLLFVINLSLSGVYSLMGLTQFMMYFGEGTTLGVNYVHMFGAGPLHISGFLESFKAIFLGPLPSFLKGTPMNHTFVRYIGAFTIWLLLPYFGFGLFYAVKHKRRESFVMYFCFFLFLITLVLYNVAHSELFRYRLPTMYFILFFAAVGISKSRRHLLPYYSIYGILICLALLKYAQMDIIIISIIILSVFAIVFEYYKGHINSFKRFLKYRIRSIRGN